MLVFVVGTVNDGLVWGAGHGENPLEVMGRSPGVKLHFLPLQRLGYSHVSRVPLALEKKYTKEHKKKKKKICERMQKKRGSKLTKQLYKGSR